MEPTSRLYQCLLCHEQVVICSKCDHGQIYCGRRCSTVARANSLKSARSRYQSTFNGKRNHAASQARYRMRLSKKVMDHGSPPTHQHASIVLLENNSKKIEKRQVKSFTVCCFCKKPVSGWFRKHFLRRRGHQKDIGSQAIPQAP